MIHNMKIRKGLRGLVAIGLVALMCAGCGGGAANSSVEKPFDVKDVTGEDIYHSEPSSNVVWKLSYTYPEVSGGVKEAAEAINDSIGKYIEFWKETDESVINQQLEVISPDENGEIEQDMPWGDEMNYGISRNDGKVFSVCLNTYFYAGGAHGMPDTRTLNFDSKTGAELLLKDIAKVDEATLIEEVNAILIQQCEAMEQGEDNPLFDDWRNYIHMVICDGNWYFADNGFHTTASVYLLAPYAAGPIDFCIPYEDCTFLKDEYKK